VKRIDILPDDALLEILDFYMAMHPSYGDKMEVEAWQSLVHVCRRWRSLVLESPRRLKLRLFCTPETPTKGSIGVWPALPLIVMGITPSSSGTKNIITALGQTNRICQVVLLDLASWQLEQVLAPMQVSFPELTEMRFSSHAETLSAIPIPDSFLGGSSPSLQSFQLIGIPFPGLPKLLLSATRLVSLWLSNIPHSGYISPEAMVSLLSALSSLETLHIEYQSPQSHPDLKSRSLSPLKRSVLPTLDKIRFKGVTEYLEDLVTFIDAPRLNTLRIDFFNQIDFDCRRLARFINRTPTLRARDKAHVKFQDWSTSLVLPAQSTTLRISISCREPDWQLSSIEQVCNSFLHDLFTIQDLYIEHRYSLLAWKNDAIESTLWLQLLLPFTAVKNLYLSKEFAPGIAAALQEVVGTRITVVLPSLQNIFVEEGLEPLGPFQENIGQFVTARQLSGHPVTISIRKVLDWD
jgi:F-box-like